MHINITYQHKGVTITQFLKQRVCLYSINHNKMLIPFALYSEAIEYIDRYLIDGLPHHVEHNPPCKTLVKPTIAMEYPTASKDRLPTIANTNHTNVLTHHVKRPIPTV